MRSSILQLSASLTGLLATLSLVFFLHSCASRAEETKPALVASAATPPATPVDGFIVQASSLNDDLEIAGSIAPNQQVSIQSELPRKITHVLVREGITVSKGALLFQLDDADLQAQLQRLRQQENLAILNEKRLKDLIAHEAAVQQDYDAAYTALEVLRAEIRQLLVTISKTRIRAPFSGRIGIVNVHPGALVSPGLVLTNLVDESQVKLDFSVPEKYARYIPLGSKQSFTLASDSIRHTATIVAREATVNEGTRTLLMRAVSPNGSRDILAGQSARVKLNIGTSANAFMVPTNVLIPSAQGYSIFKSENGKAVMLPVETGQRNAEQIQVLKGIKAGDTIITTNLLRLAPGTAVSFVQVQ